MTSWGVIRETIALNRRAWLALSLGLTALYYFGLTASATISTGHLPNYVTFYNWPANVLRIIRSTPALMDMPAIIDDEWLVELGAINYHYGHGVAEWSLEIIPSHVGVALLLSALVATSLLLLHRSRAQCPLGERGAGAAVTGAGALCVATSNITMTWVACCATPTWVAGLSLIGIETSSAYALLPYGGDLSMGGFSLLLATNYWLARRCVPRLPREPALRPDRLAIQDR
jgi:hypothetical protein